MSAAPDPTTSASCAIERLYQDYRRPILSYLTRLIGEHHTAEDLCQETFLKALRGWPQRDPQASSAAWLYRIATNTAYDHMRRSRRVCLAPLFEAESPAYAAHLDARTPDAGDAVRATLARMPDCYRVPLVLHVCQERSTQEIAAALGCSSSAVKMRLLRARARFRQLYREH